MRCTFHPEQIKTGVWERMKKLICALVGVLSLSAQAERIHCRWEPGGFRPSTYLQYDTKRKIVETLSGWDDPNCPQPGRNRGLLLNLPKEVTAHQCLRTYTGVRLVPGFTDPYFNKGMTLVGFEGDVLMAHLRLTHNGKNWLERGTTYPFEAYWGDDRLPATPDRPGKRWKTKGYCWTDRMQAKQRTND